MGIYLVIGLICGVICSVVASNKGRSPVGWFFLGFLFGWIPLIIVCCVSNLKEEEAHRARVDNENHRLREQLRQERIKGEVFRQHTMRRLDVHDQQLGTDTRMAPQLEGGAGGPAGYLEGGGGGQIPFAAQAFPGADPARSWYYDYEGQPMGPVTTDQMVSYFMSGAVRPFTLVWAEGMKDWAPANLVPEFMPYARA